MKLAVMQPYFFPYLGYFQLAAAVDRFVILDDVNFIKGGWINRNRILLRGHPLLFSVPLEHPSPYVAIHKTRLAHDSRSRRKLFATIEQCYRRAPHFETVYPLIRSVLANEPEFVGQLARQSVLAVANFLELSTNFVPTSCAYGNNELKGVARVIDICRREGATEYYNLPGGTVLYDQTAFAEADIDLRFIAPQLSHYRQYSCPFVAGLSMIDVLMFNDCDAVRNMLSNFKVH